MYLFNANESQFLESKHVFISSFCSVSYKNNWSYRLCCNFVLFWINVLLKLSNIFGSLFLLALEPKWETSFSRSMVLSMIMPAIPSPAISFYIYWKKSIWAVIEKSLYISPTESYLYWSNVLAWHRVAISKEWTFTPEPYSRLQNRCRTEN